MIRDLKVLGLALLAAVALGAVGAQGALAIDDQFVITDPEIESAVLTGESKFVQHVTISAVPVTCSIARFSGTVMGNPSQTIVAHPEFVNCALGETEIEAAVDTAACTFDFSSKTTENPHPYGVEGAHAPIDITCPEETYMSLCRRL